ncbi:unnamed protein product, partial [Symbiodinium sp. CCMP2456]
LPHPCRSALRRIQRPASLRRTRTRHRPGSLGLCPSRSSCKEAALSHSLGACP